MPIRIGHGRGARRALGVVGGVIAMSAALSGCLLTQAGPPGGAAPLRYRDALFNDVGVTTDIQYGSAPDQNNQPVALKLDPVSAHG